MEKPQPLGRDLEKGPTLNLIDHFCMRGCVKAPFCPQHCQEVLTQLCSGHFCSRDLNRIPKHPSATNGTQLVALTFLTGSSHPGKALAWARCWARKSRTPYPLSLSASSRAAPPAMHPLALLKVGLLSNCNWILWDSRFRLSLKASCPHNPISALGSA